MANTDWLGTSACTMGYIYTIIKNTPTGLSFLSYGFTLVYIYIIDIIVRTIISMFISTSTTLCSISNWVRL